nr:hypothetical protein [Microbacterium sp. RURRCA19A]
MGEDVGERGDLHRHVGAVLPSVDGERRVDEVLGQVGVGEAALQLAEALALCQRVARDVDEAHDVVRDAGHGDDGAAVRVPLSRTAEVPRSVRIGTKVTPGQTRMSRPVATPVEWRSATGPSPVCVAS